MIVGNGLKVQTNPTCSFVADTPLRRFGQPEEVAAVAVLLASDEATYLTGSELTINGGILAGSAANPSAK